MRGLSLILEIIVKIGIALAIGFGLCALTFGIALFYQSGVTSFDVLEKQGPPPADLFLACGVALLSMALTMIVLSVGPLARRRWFISSEDEPRRQTFEDIQSH